MSAKKKFSLGKELVQTQKFEKPVSSKREDTSPNSNNAVAIKTVCLNSDEKNFSMEMTQIINSLTENIYKMEKKLIDISNKVDGIQQHINTTY